VHQEDIVAIIDDKGRMLLLGLAVGAAAAIVGREFFAPVRRLGRPLAKSAVKSGMAAIAHGREGAALLGEHLADLIAEATAEREQASMREAK
jgi:hypothetical protein